MVNFGKCNANVAKELRAMISEVTRAFLQANPNLSQEDDREIVRVYMDMMREAFVDWNTAWGCVDMKKVDKQGLFAIRSTGGWGGIMYPKEFPIQALVDILAAKYKFVNLNMTSLNQVSTDTCELAVYVEDGPQQGIYSVDDTYKKKIVDSFIPACEEKVFGKIEKALKRLVPTVNRTKDVELIPVANGIFNIKTKQLLPFSPEFVFTSKCRIGYNQNASNVSFKDAFGVWDFESWILDIMSDVEEDKTALLYTMLFAIRPNTLNYKHMLWISDNEGNSGKGTCAKIVSNVVGQMAIKNLSLSGLLKDFMLADLPGKSLILGLDNEFKEYLDKNSNLIKLLSTKEEMTVDRKYRDPLTFKFTGGNLQLMNSWPKLSDKSDAMMRRWYALEFKKTFEGKENKAIKETYLEDKNVLEYILKRLLELEYKDELPETANSREALRKIRETNNPIYEFVEEVISTLPADWNVYPKQGLYALYVAWYKAKSYDVKFLQKPQGFVDDLAQALRHTGGWEYDAKKQMNTTTQEVQQRYIQTNVKWEAIEEYRPQEFWGDNQFENLPVSNRTGKVKTNFTPGCIVRVVA